MDYIQNVKLELLHWRHTLQKPADGTGKIAKDLQNKMNGMLPQKYHEIVTHTIREMVKAVIMGAEYTVHAPQVGISLAERDAKLEALTNQYKMIAAIEGAGTGAGGLVIGMADFPLLLSIKIKFLYEVAALYGVNVQDYRERIYLLSIFELAFSSPEYALSVYERLEKWSVYKKTLPKDIENFDWMNFQQEYRDYLDFAKIMQLIPVIGAPIGAYANHKLMKKLSYTAMQAYRMRWVLYS